ncbi:barstar family protein [Pseudomonas sp. P2757]|uniref:barstar family protein n=1 Tax=unclassified Pseudomonas TaxID=196821 RepID=UPI003B5CE002
MNSRAGKIATEYADLMVSVLVQLLCLPSAIFRREPHDLETPMMMRKPLVQIDVSKVKNSEQLHTLLKDALEFPEWYGGNWDAFWDAITGLVEMPVQLKISGWETLSERLPRDAQLMQRCFADMETEYPALVPDLVFD